MAISSYAELKSAAADWLNRDDLTAVIPTFVALTESIVNNTLRLRQQLTRATAPISAEYEALPAGFLEMKSLHLQTTPITPLGYVAPGSFNNLADAGVSGRPSYFTVLGDQIRFARIPDTTYTAELVYFTKLPALSDDAPTNWLLTDAPEIYLYGTLLQAAPYLRDDDRVVLWKSAFDEAMARLTGADTLSAYGASPLVIRRGVIF